MTFREMQDEVEEVAASTETGENIKQAVRCGNAVCPHCTYVNYCEWDSGHTGSCHCDNGHYWGNGC